MADAGRAKVLQRQLGVRGPLAIVGGYVVAALACIVLARTLPLAPIDASVLAMILSFAVYAAVAVWCFAAKGLGRALLGVAGAALLLLVAAWGSGGFEAGL